MIRRRIRPDDDDPLIDDDPLYVIKYPPTPKSTKRTKKYLKEREFQLLSWYWPLAILFIGILLYHLVYFQDQKLPQVITKTEAEQNTKLFSGERSRIGLRKLTNLGPRVVGSEANEVHAPLVIENEVKDIQSKAHPSQSILIERQKGSGVYYLGFEYGLTNIYGNIQNVLVLVEGSQGNHSILINCHFDSVTGSPGASDDGISCAVMMELIRVLSLSDQRLKHNLVFLFNGAEEVPLEGSHLSLQHEWTKKCSVVLNMDAGGHGGRAMLFQSGPKHSWIFDYYAKNAPHPHGLVMSEEFFQSGIMPSDTDFRIFRDFGNMIGLDFAFARNGYVYHTTHDTEEDLPSGCHQHLGDNILAVLRELGFASELDHMEENADGEVVYYDYLGMFMISYSTKLSVFINLAAIIVAIFSIGVYIGRVLEWSWFPQFSKTNKIQSPESKTKTEEPLIEIDVKLNTKERSLNTPQTIFNELNVSVTAFVTGQLLGIAASVAVSFVINRMAEFAMPWYGNIWLLFPLYWCPCLVAYGAVLYFVDMWRAKNGQTDPVATTQLNLVAAQIPTIFLFAIFTYLGIRSSSIFLLPVLSSAIANLLLHLTNLHKTDYKWVVAYMLVHLPSLMFQLYLILITYSIMIAIQGRSGTINTDFYMGVASALFSIFSLHHLMPLMGIVKKQIFTLAALAAISVVVTLMALKAPIGFPYKAGPYNAAPQRYWIMHSDREFYDETQTLRRHETGFFVLNQDPNSPRTVSNIYKNKIHNMTSDCETEMNCGLPYYSTRMVDLGPTSSWIPASAPVIPNETELLVTRDCQQMSKADESICVLECTLRGPDRLTMTFSPRVGAKLVKWSLDSPIKPTSLWQDRPYYYVMLVRGEITDDFNITMEFSVTPDQKNGSPILDIGLAGNHVHHESEMTKDFQDFINSFADWTTIMGWISAYKVYVF